MNERIDTKKQTTKPKQKNNNKNQKASSDKLKTLRETKYSSKTIQAKNMGKHLKNRIFQQNLLQKGKEGDFVVHFRGKNKKKRDIMNYGF